MAKRRDSRQYFAICIQSDDPDLLTPCMIYQVLPNESAAKSNYVRVIDNEGEDYLYPAAYFVLVDFPRAIEQVLDRAFHELSQRVPAGERHGSEITQTSA